MPSPINFTETENRMLQSIFRELYENDEYRSTEGPLLLGIVNKLETWPTLLTLTEQENRRIQYQYESFAEIITPYPYPYSPQTFGQDTRQLSIVKSILTKVVAAQ